jgi:osmoprotectant transport system substrate-binding protein
LSEAFVAYDVTVLDYAPGEDKNVFVVTGDVATANGLSKVSDLTGVDPVTLGGPPECEERDTCYLGLVDTYGISQLGFESYQEGAARIAALKGGEIEVAVLFSTQPIIAVEGFVSLEDDLGLIRAENIVPVVRNEVLEAYGTNMSDLLNAISAKITTEALIALNGLVEIDTQDPDDVAKAWLQENGFLG